MEHDDFPDLAEVGRRLGHDLYCHSRLPLQAAWPTPVREGFAAAAARGAHRGAHWGAKWGEQRAQPDRFMRKWLQLRLGALARGRAVAADVTPQALRALDLSVCPVTREPLSRGTGLPSDASIDRLNNDGAYVLGNLALMSVRANRAKAALDFAAVLQRAVARQAMDGLTPAAWMRLAALMLGPVFAQRPLDAPDLPLCVELPASSLRTATQQVQRLLTLAAGQAAERNRLLRALAPVQPGPEAMRRLSLLAERLHHGLKQLSPGTPVWDVWLCPELMSCLHAWRASHGPDDWGRVAQRAAQLAGGSAVPARALLPWRLATRGHLAGGCPPAGRSRNGHMSTGRSLALAACLAPLALSAQTAAQPEPPAPQQVQISGQHYDNAVGSSDAASQGVIRAELLKSRPALRPGEILEFVPGVIVTQHSGDGKANQYFLRGFNLDHGTDFATTVNGMPVNMPSHGHGQGYSDLNFLLPELVDRIAYRKGPYFARNGDFASAGSADIAYRTRLDAPFAQLTLGRHGYQRAVAAGSTDIGPGLHALGAVEWMGNDGPWTVAEGLRRRNGVFTLSGGTEAQGWQASAMAYSARWTSTDQIPEHLIGSVYNGRSFGRYDAVDASDGGETRRVSLSGDWHRRSSAGTTRLSAYAMRYRMDLWSNFSFALERPDSGDQFGQHDARSVWGLAASHAVQHGLGNLAATTEFGAQLRHDRIRVGLYDTQLRQTIATTREDDVRQTLGGVYGQTALEFTPWLRGVFGLRADQLRTRVDALTLAANSGRASATQWSPKASLVFGPFNRTEFFVNAGRGLHSNDARGTTIRTDPKTGEAADKVPPLVASQGWELGLRSEALPGLQTSLALWRLASDSELVYIGDAGATEASAASRRRGLEFNNRWQPVPWLLVDADFAWTHARFANGERIPNSVDRVASLAATLRKLGPWSASLNWRYLGAGPLVEDNSVRSIPAITTNLRLNWQLPNAWGLGRDSELTLDVFNLFDRKVYDIQYVYESQLPGQDAWTGRHVHPAEPRTMRVTFKLGF